MEKHSKTKHKKLIEAIKKLLEAAAEVSAAKQAAVREFEKESENGSS